jgi:hypothetical protein
VLRSIYIPASVEILGKWCFNCCDLLETVTFESDSRLTVIEEKAFRYCRSLRSICIPRSVHCIGRKRFVEGSVCLKSAFEPGSEFASIDEDRDCDEDSELLDVIEHNHSNVCPVELRSDIVPASNGRRIVCPVVDHSVHHFADVAFQTGYEQFMADVG